MPRTTKPLKDSQLTTAKPKDSAYGIFDGGGLIFEVRPTGLKFWRYKYKNPVTGTDTKLTLGEYPALSLAKAREKRGEFETMLAHGLDPKHELELQRAKLVNAHSFEKVTRAWHAEQCSKEVWSSDTGQKTLRKLENHLFPLMGNMPIDSIKTMHLRQALNSIDAKGINRTARDIRANLARIFGFAIQQGFAESNPARELDGILISKKTKHYSSLPLEQLPDFLQRIENYKRGTPLTKLCMLLSLHVFIRSSEVRFARWAEIDFDKCQWVIPASREAVEGVRYSDRGAKMKEAHLVPLSPQAIRILKQLQQFSGHSENVFPSRDNPKKFMSENTINEALRHMGYNTQSEICGHGFRSMACGALIQSTLFSEDAVERQMSHKERNEVRRAYTHMAEFLEERKNMMSFWSSYIEANRDQHITAHDYAKQQAGQQGADNSIIQFKRG